MPLDGDPHSATPDSDLTTPTLPTSLSSSLPRVSGTSLQTSDPVLPPLATQTNLNQFFSTQNRSSTKPTIHSPRAGAEKVEHSSIPSQSTLDSHIVRRDPPDPFVLMRKTLVADPRAIYLGGDAADRVTAHIGWVHDGTMERCVLADNIAAFQAKLDEYRRHPDGDHPALPDSAVFSAIVRLSANRFFMQADGNYTGQSLYDRGLADLKLSALAEAPDSEIGSAEFQAVLCSLDTIIRAKRTRGYQIVKGLFDTSEGKRQFRIKHALFTVRSFWEL